MARDMRWDRGWRESLGGAKSRTVAVSRDRPAKSFIPPSIPSQHSGITTRPPHRTAPRLVASTPFGGPPAVAGSIGRAASSAVLQRRRGLADSFPQSGLSAGRRVQSSSQPRLSNANAIALQHKPPAAQCSAPFATRIPPSTISLSASVATSASSVLSMVPKAPKVNVFERPPNDFGGNAAIGDLRSTAPNIWDLPAMNLESTSSVLLSSDVDETAVWTQKQPTVDGVNGVALQSTSSRVTKSLLL